jgi:hypothetical protein
MKEEREANMIESLRRLAHHVFGQHPATGRAHVRVIHRRPLDFDERRGLWIFHEPDPAEHVSRPIDLRMICEEIIEGARFGRLSESEAWNLIVNAGRIFLHTQGYGTAGLGANGLNWIALSNDAVTETATSTTLSNEIVANGLSRAQGAVTLPVGAGNQTTVDKTFTCSTAQQAAQKTALFSASSSGTMNHVLAFTQRTLQPGPPGDTLQITTTITLG